jgi:phosphoesterase RecJ-like protein
MNPAEPFYPSFVAPFAEFLRGLAGRRLAVVGHARPDGDCIGSQVALARVLRALGHDAICANLDPVPRRLAFCVGDTPFVRIEGLPAGELSALYVDCADQSRAGDRFRDRFPAPWANFDHHLANPGYAAVNFVDADSAATCEILAALFLQAGLPIDPVSAQALFVGIATDTGQFRFHSTSQRTFLLSAELVARGARPAVASEELYERESPGKLQLLQRFLASFRFECGGRVCIGVLPAGIYEQTGTQPEDIEGMVDYARGVDGVEIGVLIEERQGAIKASLRGKEPSLRVDLIAARFGGGGHACAAGLSQPHMGLAEFAPRLSAALAARLAEVDASRPRSP